VAGCRQALRRSTGAGYANLLCWLLLKQRLRCCDDVILFVLQALAVRALGGRLQAGLEAFNRRRLCQSSVLAVAETATAML
jgi:hypothetical protein